MTSVIIFGISFENEDRKYFITCCMIVIISSEMSPGVRLVGIWEHTLRKSILSLMDEELRAVGREFTLGCVSLLREPHDEKPGGDRVRAEWPDGCRRRGLALRRDGAVDLESLSSTVAYRLGSISAKAWNMLAGNLGKFCTVLTGTVGDLILVRLILGKRVSLTLFDFFFVHWA